MIAVILVDGTPHVNFRTDQAPDVGETVYLDIAKTNRVKVVSREWYRNGNADQCVDLHCTRVEKRRKKR